MANTSNIRERSSVASPPNPEAQHHLGFAGSISLRPSTLIAVVRDVVQSLARHGFERCYFLNGHGGNTAPIQVAMIEALNELPGLEVRAEAWWRVPEVSAAFEEAGIQAPAHTGFDDGPVDLFAPENIQGHGRCQFKEGVFTVAPERIRCPGVGRYDIVI